MKLRRFGFVLLALAWGAATPGPAAAEDFSKEAGAFVQSLGDQAIAIITDASLNAGDREQRFHQMFVTSFDVPAIGRFVLGRYWRTASDAQKTEFLKLFEDMIVKTYNNRFKDYKGEQFVITGARADADSAVVSTNVVSAQVRSGQPVKVEWRVLKPQGKLKIVDVVIEGVSMSVTQQQEFGSVIQRNGGQIDGLLATMRERVQQQNQAARS
ncbi:MAG: ABC transporter substrate-binding protein [Proteobacteria bacterium]|nr:ABC transporter substrate-binding protein [Pseudomonadota bacterium]